MKGMTMSTSTRLAVAAACVLALAARPAAQNREHQQQAAELRILQEQQQQLSVAIAQLSDVKLSANWMAPAGHPGEDARLYEAADALGTSAWRRFLTVTLPGAKYGLISAMMVVFTMAIAEFGVPKIIGGRFQVLAVDVYKQVIGQQNFPGV